MKKIIVIATALAAASFAQAQLNIDVTGVPGSGVTTWTFSGSGGSATGDGSIRDTTNASFSAFDTGQFPFGEDTVLDTSIQDQVFALTGDATVTVGGTTQSIAGIFIDDDGGSADDMGIRADTQLDYLTGDASSWTGSGTVNVDINTFALGVWSINSTDGQAMWISDPTTVTFEAVPEPATMVILGGLAAMAARRRRK